MRTTLNISDEAYYIAKAIARERNRSLGSVVSELIIARPSATEFLDPGERDEGGFPIFRCIRRVTSAAVEALEEESL